MISLLVESGVRSLLFAGAVGLVLRLGRVRDVTTRLTAWTCVLYGALLLPMAAPFLPPLPVPVLHPGAIRIVAVMPTAGLPAHSTEISQATPQIQADWRIAGLSLYLIVATALLGRLWLGLVVARRLRRASRPVSDSHVLKLLGVRAPVLTESGALTVPITVGWMRPCIVLPDSWRDWDEAKTEAVLAHELSHVRRGDYGTLLLASLYRCLFWFNPLAWWLDRHLRELADQASDDSALRGTVDRTQYADVLLSFFKALQGPRGRVRWEGVAMARGTRAGRRIDRILAPDRKLSTPARWPVIAGLALLCIPLLYLAGSLQPVAMAQAGTGQADSTQSRDKSQDGYVIVSGDNTTMNGSDKDLRRALRFRYQIGDDYIWFRRDGKGYVIRDSSILKEAHKLFEPQQDLGRRQGELGDQQAKLGELQAKLGEKQSGVRTTPKDLTRDIEKLKEELKTAGTSEELGDVQALIAKLQAEVADQQAHIGDQQAKLGEEQAKLGQEQAKLGAQQAILGEEQARRGEEAGRHLKKLIDEAFKKGLVEPEPH